jgi:hypothetical protein
LFTPVLMEAAEEIRNLYQWACRHVGMPSQPHGGKKE